MSPGLAEAACWQDEHELKQGVAHGRSFGPPHWVASADRLDSGLKSPRDAAEHRICRGISTSMINALRLNHGGQRSPPQAVALKMCNTSRTGGRMRGHTDRDFCRLIATVL